MTTKVIKGNTKVSSHRPSDSSIQETQVIHKRVMDASEKANSIIESAEKGAAKILNEANAVLEKSKRDREDAIKKGYAEGESKGLAQVTEKLIALSALRGEFYNQAESEVIKLVMTIAEKVIGRIANENIELIRSVVHQALEGAIGDRITVKMNPEDYANLVAADHEFKDVIDRTRRLMLREDESISKGGCVVETEVGTIDAQIETQLDAIRKALTA